MPSGLASGPVALPPTHTPLRLTIWLLPSEFCLTCNPHDRGAEFAPNTGLLSCSATCCRLGEHHRALVFLIYETPCPDKGSGHVGQMNTCRPDPQRAMQALDEIMPVGDQVGTGVAVQVAASPAL